MALNEVLKEIINKEIKKQSVSVNSGFKVLVKKANTRKIQTKTLSVKSF